MHSKIHFYTKGYEGLYDHVPKNMLPFEYGGSAGKFDDFKQFTLNELLKKRYLYIVLSVNKIYIIKISFRKYLMDPEQWVIQQKTNNCES